MLGKTHIVGSLALMHAGLLGYTVHANRSDTGAESGKGEYLEVFGLSIGEPLSLIEYGLMVAAVGSFILWLLHIGSWRVRTAHLGLTIASLLSLRFVAAETYPLTISMMVLCFALGTVLPDIDSESSTLGRYITPISRAIPHRTFTHTIWAVLVIAGFSWYFESVYLLALALGYAVHIVEDSFSQMGIRWFYPVSVRNIKQGSRFPFAYETGGFAESLMFFTAIGVHAFCAVFVIWSNLGIGGAG